MKSGPLGALILSGLFLSMRAEADNTASFVLPSGVAVRIVEAPFQRSKFKIEGCTRNDAPCLINGRIAFGGFQGELPKTYVRSIVVTFDGQSYDLDTSAMYNAWGSRPLEHPGVIRYFGGKCFYKGNCQFRGVFADGALSFAAEWRIVNGRQIRTVLTGSDDVVHLFMKHIDPPEYE